MKEFNDDSIEEWTRGKEFISIPIGRTSLSGVGLYRLFSVSFIYIKGNRLNHSYTNLTAKSLNSLAHL